MNKNMNMNMKIEKSMEVDELHSYQPTRRSRSRSRKTPSFSSSLLDSILRSIDDETNYHHNNNNIPFPINSSDPCNYKPTPPNINYIHSPQSRDHHQHIPTLRRAIMIDNWVETQNRMKYAGYNNNNVSSARNVSYWDSISISSGNATSFTTSSSASSDHDQQHPHTPSTYTSLPNSFTISSKHAQHIFQDHDSHKPTPLPAALGSLKFFKSTKLRAMKMYSDLKKVKQQQQQQHPMSPATRISTFLYSLFAIKNKSKLNQTLKKSPSSTNNKRDSTTCTSFSRSTSMMSNKKQYNTTNNCTTNSIKRSVRLYPADNDTLIIDQKSINERVIPLPKHERRRFTHNKYMKNYKTTFMHVNVEDDDDVDDEDDLFELEIIGGVANVTYGRELPVFETTDLTKIRI
ncbi:uncharacterized protein [Rutidosis leptorrhynchoides]|uniref:uncharacterized protein n=1 Tax=Rutidosis leptorrhynchoides TaxID=125765 RepID=UPI003A99ACD5